MQRGGGFERVEASEAIFEAGEFSIEKKSASTSVAIALPFDGAG